MNTMDRMRYERIESFERHNTWPFIPEKSRRWGNKGPTKRVPRHRVIGGFVPDRVRGPGCIMSWPGACRWLIEERWTKNWKW